MGRKKAVKVDKQNIKFVNIPRRKMVFYDVDMTKPTSKEPIPYGESPSKLQDAIVKLRVKYKKGTEEKVYLFVSGFLESVGKLAKHIYRPELIAIGEEVGRIPELKADLDPMEAIEMWLENRPPITVEEKEVKRMMKKYLKKVNVADEKINPVPFSIRQFNTDNFMPFKGVQELGPIPDGVYGVIGRYEGAEDRSNRAGKSVFLETVLYALYGEGRKLRTMDEYIHRDEDEMSLQIGMEIKDEGEFIVGRNRKRGVGSNIIYIKGSRFKKAEAKEEIYERLGIGHDDFVRTSFVRQGDLDGILGQKSSQIKDDVMRWIGSEIWTQAEKLIASDMNNLKAEMQKIVATYDSMLEIVNKGKPKVADIKATKSQLAEMQKDFADDSTKRMKVDDIKHRLEKSKRITKALKKAENKDEVVRQLKEEEAELSIVQSELDKVRMEAAVINDEIETREKRLGKFKGKCPVDDGKCPRTKKINKNKLVQKKKIAELKDERNTYNMLIKHKRKEKKGVEERVEKLKSAKHEIANAEYVLEQEGRKAEGMVKLRRELKKAEKRVLSDEAIPTEDDVTNKRKQLTEMLARSRIHKEAKEKIEQCSHVLAEIEEEMQVYRYLRFMCGKKGIPSMQVENALVTIEGQVNSILSLIGTEQTLSFSFETELKKKASMCYRCGYVYEDNKEKKCGVCDEKRGKEKSDQLSINVIDAGNVQSYEADSGGGKAILAFAVRIALARFLGIKILFLDEICGSLDDENLRMMIDVVKKLTKRLGFRQVFVISHRPEVAEALPRNILITRYPGEGWSEYSWA